MQPFLCFAVLHRAANQAEAHQKGQLPFVREPAGDVSVSLRRMACIYYLGNYTSANYR